MLSISIEPEKTQEFTVDLAEQNCKIKICQLEMGLFLSLYVNDAPVILSALCLNEVKLVRHKYLGFKGDLFFTDTQGSDNPVYDELGTRFLLYYEAAE